MLRPKRSSGTGEFCVLCLKLPYEASCIEVRTPQRRGHNLTQIGRWAGPFPVPWHNSHIPYPSQALQGTGRVNLSPLFWITRIPVPLHLWQRPVPLQYEQAVDSPSIAVPRVPRLYYAPSGSLATRSAVNACPEHQPSDDDGVYASERSGVVGEGAGTELLTPVGQLLPGAQITSSSRLCRLSSDQLEPLTSRQRNWA